VTDSRQRLIMLVTVIITLVALAASALADPPPNYYDSVDTSSQEAHRQTLHNVIDGHTKIPYTSSSTDTWDVLELADEDPLNSSRILDVYRNRDFTKHGGGNNDYNREHVWPKSYGFPDDGSSNKPYSDCHHLFLCYINYNSDRDSRIFDDCFSGCNARSTDEHDGQSGVNYFANGSPVGIWETWIGRRGDVARACFYMDVRYEGDSGEIDLILVDDPALIVSCQTGDNEDIGYMGLLETLMQWHLDDPVDQKERDRNDYVYQYQHNRNPFIDHPEWVDMIFGNGTTPVAPEETPAVPQITGVFPNPFNPSTQVSFSVQQAGPVQVQIVGLDGRYVRSLVNDSRTAGEHRVTWNGCDDQGRTVASGPYLVQLRAGNQVDSCKLLMLK